MVLAHLLNEQILNEQKCIKPRNIICLHQNANKDFGYFVKMVSDLDLRDFIAEGTLINFQAAVDVGMGNSNIPEIMDYFLKLER